MLRLIFLVALCTFIGTGSAALDEGDSDDLLHSMRAEREVVAFLKSAADDEGVKDDDMVRSIRRVLESSPIDTVNDDDLLHYIQTEKHVVVLFANRHCKSCDSYEKALMNLRDDLVEALSAWVLKVVDSRMAKLYAEKDDAALVFFRNGIPLLYNGPIHDDDIYDTFVNNKEPVVKELTDENFEHLTQASTGATTGDWFVMFYSTDCVNCQRMGARWEAVGAELKQRMNVARLNKQTTGVSTATRLRINKVPEFVLFRQGKMYRYDLPVQNVHYFVSWAESGFQRLSGEKIPDPPSRLTRSVQQSVDFVQHNSWLIKLAGIVVVVSLIAYTALRSKPENELEDDPFKMD